MYSTAWMNIIVACYVGDVAEWRMDRPKMVEYRSFFFNTFMQELAKRTSGLSNTSVTQHLE